MPILPEFGIPTQESLIEYVNKAYQKLITKEIHPEKVEGYMYVYQKVIQAVRNGTLKEWKGRNVYGKPTDNLSSLTARYGKFAVHDPRVRESLPFEGYLFRFGIDFNPAKVENVYQIYMASHNSSGRIKTVLGSLLREINRLPPTSGTILNIGLNNCTDSSLQEVLRYVQDHPFRNTEINVYYLSPDSEMFDDKRGLRCTNTVQNAMIINQQERRPRLPRKPYTYTVLIDDDIVFKPQEDGGSNLEVLSAKFEDNSYLKIASGSFAVLPYKHDPFYDWSNAHKTPNTLALQVPKPTPYGAMLMVETTRLPENLLPTGRFSVNDIFLYHHYAANSTDFDETKWPSFSYPDVTFYHPGEKDIFDWVRAKRQTVAIFENGALEELFAPSTTARIKDVKLRLLNQYRESVTTSLERVYGLTNLNTLGNIFIYDFFLPQVINGSIYH